MSTWPELFVECPRCRTAGHHPFELGTFTTRTIPGRDGEPIELVSLSDPPDGTPIITRTCASCGHGWQRSLPEA